MYGLMMAETSMMLSGCGYNHDNATVIDYTPCKYKGMTNKQLGKSKKKKRKNKRG